MRPMGVIMNEYGTDKNVHHRYAEVYERLLPDRSAVKLMMEVGIAEGRGLLAWREICSEALCVGFDKEHCHCERGPRLEFHQGDMRDRSALLRAAAGRQFDFICEDAAHQLDANLLCLFWLWPFLAPGGVYVIEEMQDVNEYRANCSLFAGCEYIDTAGPYGGNEPLIALRKPR